MRTSDPVALGQAAKEAMDQFGELTECAGFGTG
jgi:hypothetical protein